MQIGQSCKYVGILWVDMFLAEKMRVKVSKEPFRRVKNILKSHLHDECMLMFG